MRTLALLLGVGTALAAAPAGAAPAAPAWTLHATGTEARLRGLAPVDDRVAWAGGTGGTILRTTDGGRSWQVTAVPGAEELDFRDVAAWDDQRALALSIGPGESSRIYRTRDGGRTWAETFRNADPKAFYDCFAFFDRRHGLALSDAVDGKFRLISTDDGGQTWSVLPTDGMPAAADGEGAFAASGTCLVAQRGGESAWFAAHSRPRARIFRTEDRGRTWTVADSTISGEGTSGVYTLAMRDYWNGVALGGDYTAPAAAPAHAAVSTDSGRTWQPPAKVPGEYRSGAAWVGRTDTVLAVGPTGSDISTDAGRTWARFDSGSFDAVECTKSGACWASGEKGRVATLTR